jgi:hypothetical protein
VVSFITYLSGITIVAVFVRFFRTYFRRKKYVLAGITVMAFILGLLLVNTSYVEQAFARKFKYTATYTANDPIGEEKGFIPGRVVWVHDADATNENMTNTEGDYWFMNTDQGTVDQMLAKGIKKLVEKNSVEEAWNTLFRYFNFTHDKGMVGYKEGEKIFIKINLTNSCCSFSSKTSTQKNGRHDKMDSTPELVVSLLKQLVDSVGIDQANITVGDPFRRFPDIYWDLIHTAYPNVVIMDDAGVNGRTQVTITGNSPLVFSDGSFKANIPMAYMEADYFINMPCLKTHSAAGVTMAAKNHQGSVMEAHPTSKTDVTSQSAYFMHYSLPGEEAGEGTGLYRHLVDYMGHEKLGGNTILYLMDAIWTGSDWEGNIVKWDMAPFNGDYPNSLFLSQDPVAIECVGFDFLYDEFKDDADDGYPAMTGAIEYLKHAADPASWPSGVTYDPEGDGSVLKSLGVYEHWNNGTDKKYSRNLGEEYGIELVPVFENFLIDIGSVDTFLFGGSAFYSLSVIVENGKVNMMPELDQYEEGATVTLSSIPNAGYKFLQWSGDTTSNDNPLTLTMNGNKEITAEFILTDSCVLTVSAINGSVTLSPPGGEYSKGTNVELTPVPDENYLFDNWSGDTISSSNPITVTMSVNKEITANFVLKDMYTVTTTATNGSIFLDPEGGEYYTGTEVMVTAVPDEGYEFTGWISNLSMDDTLDEQNITVNKNINIAAQFTSITSVRDLGYSGNLVIYPVPVNKSDDLHVHFKEKINNYLQVNIYNISGKMVFDKMYWNTMFKIPLSKIDKLNNGTYILEIVNDKEVHHTKFIIK